jgi:hypothetical protein
VRVSDEVVSKKESCARGFQRDNRKREKNGGSESDGLKEGTKREAPSLVRPFFFFGEFSLCYRLISDVIINSLPDGVLDSSLWHSSGS